MLKTHADCCLNFNGFFFDLDFPLGKHLAIGLHGDFSIHRLEILYRYSNEYETCVLCGAESSKRLLEVKYQFIWVQKIIKML